MILVCLFLITSAMPFCCRDWVVQIYCLWIYSDMPCRTLLTVIIRGPANSQGRPTHTKINSHTVTSMKKGCNMQYSVYRQHILCHMHVQIVQLYGTIWMIYDHHHGSALLKICSGYFQSISIDLKKKHLWEFFIPALSHCL